MSKNASYRYGYEHRRDEYPSVEYRSRDDLSAPGAASKQIQPTDDGDRHTKHVMRNQSEHPG
jgi:hypothetical protein